MDNPWEKWTVFLRPDQRKLVTKSYAGPTAPVFRSFVGFQPVVISPEVSWDYEIGAKRNWLDNKLIVNVNAYWNDIYNFQAIQQNTEFIGSDGVPLRRNFLGNVGQVRLRGFEFDGRWSPIDRLWLTFSGAYTDARYVSFANSAPPQEWTWPVGSNIPAGPAGNAPSVISLSGKRITGGVSGNNPAAPVSFISRIPPGLSTGFAVQSPLLPSPRRSPSPPHYLGFY